VQTQKSSDLPYAPLTYQPPHFQPLSMARSMQLLIRRKLNSWTLPSLSVSTGQFSPVTKQYQQCIKFWWINMMHTRDCQWLLNIPKATGPVSSEEYYPVNCYQCCSNWFEIRYSQLQLLRAKTPITTITITQILRQ